MENKNNQSFIAYESEELTRQKILNSALMDELIKYKEENTKLKHEKEILNSKIEKLEEENKTLKSDFSSMKSENGHEETMEIIENILHSNHEIKDEPLDSYDMTQKSCGNTFSNEEDLEQNKDDYKLMSRVIRPRLKPKKSKTQVVSENNPNLHKSHQCDQCPKNYTNKCYLDRHIRKFHEKVKYSCELCDKKFTETWTLKSHVLGVHEKLKRFKCNQCDKAYPQASGLSQHKRKIHPEEKSNQN